MHSNSIYLMEQFRNKYLDENKKLSIIDVGSLQIQNHQSYRELFINNNWSYVGLDLISGSNVDIVSIFPYNYPIKTNTYDIVISGQCIEHVKDIFSWIKELARILKYNGLLCIIAPHYTFTEHKYPVDCWRILPDGMNFLLTEIAGLKVLECHIQDDIIGIAQKEKI